MSLDEFKETIASLHLPYPKFIDYAIPGNEQCGVCPDNLAKNTKAYCSEMDRTTQG